MKVLIRTLLVFFTLSTAALAAGGYEVLKNPKREQILNG